MATSRKDIETLWLRYSEEGISEKPSLLTIAPNTLGWMTVCLRKEGLVME